MRLHNGEGNSFWLYKPTVFVLYPIIASIIILVLYMQFVETPTNDLKNANEKAMLDSLSCPQLGKWIIIHSANSTYSDGGYVDKNYPYAEAKYLVCTHGGVAP